MLRVATAIVERQHAFLDYGEEAMQPMVLRDIAELLEMHESTISRVTTHKFMHTPRGIFEFKYFFSSHVGTADGGECSATAIRAIIKKFVGAEKPEKPLSDNKIAILSIKQSCHGHTPRTIPQSALGPTRNEKAMRPPPSRNNKDKPSSTAPTQKASNPTS